MSHWASCPGVVVRGILVRGDLLKYDLCPAVVVHRSVALGLVVLRLVCPMVNVRMCYSTCPIGCDYAYLSGDPSTVMKALCSVLLCAAASKISRLLLALSASTSEGRRLKNAGVLKK